MKNCPFCDEEIQDGAVKCKHCGEWLEKEAQVPPKLVKINEAKAPDLQTEDTAHEGGMVGPVAISTGISI